MEDIETFDSTPWLRAVKQTLEFFAALPDTRPYLEVGSAQPGSFGVALIANPETGRDLFVDAQLRDDGGWDVAFVYGNIVERAHWDEAAMGRQMVVDLLADFVRPFVVGTDRGNGLANFEELLSEIGLGGVMAVCGYVTSWTACLEEWDLFMLSVFRWATAIADGTMLVRDWEEVADALHSALAVQSLRLEPAAHKKVETYFSGIRAMLNNQPKQQ